MSEVGISGSIEDMCAWSYLQSKITGSSFRRLYIVYCLRLEFLLLLFWYIEKYFFFAAWQLWHQQGAWIWCSVSIWRTGNNKTISWQNLYRFYSFWLTYILFILVFCFWCDKTVILHMLTASYHWFYYLWFFWILLKRTLLLKRGVVLLLHRPIVSFMLLWRNKFEKVSIPGSRMSLLVNWNILGSEL